MAFKTYAQLTVQSTVQDADLLATYRGTGPLESVTAAVLATYLNTKLTFLAPANNLSDVSSASTARTNLGVPAATRLVSAAGLATGGGDFTADRTITVAEALAADVLTGTSTAKAMTPGDTYNAFASVALTDVVSGTVAVDMSTFLNAALTFTGGSNSRTLGNPTNPKVGQTGFIRLIQSASGSNTLSFGGNWKRAGGAPTLTTTANAVDVLEYQVITSTYILYNVLLNPS